MSITDELRHFANEWDWLDYRADESARRLRAIADRIDAEHQKCIDAMWEDAKYHLSDESLTEQGWIRLPLDADGEYIHIGDVMDSKVDHLFDGKPFMVRAMVLCEDGWEAADSRFGNRYKPDSLHHHKPTVEDVLEKALSEAAMLDRPEGYWPSAADITNIVNSLAAKLQLKENE